MKLVCLNSSLEEKICMTGNCFVSHRFDFFSFSFELAVCVQVIICKYYNKRFQGSNVFSSYNYVASS